VKKKKKKGGGGGGGVERARIQSGMKTIFTVTVLHSQFLMPNITLSGQACFVRWKNQFIFLIHKRRLSLYGTGN